MHLTSLKKVLFLDEEISIFEIQHIKVRNEHFRLKVRKDLPI